MTRRYEPLQRPLERRAGDLAAVLTEHTDAEGDPFFVAVICNGCNATLAAPTAGELVAKADAEGWSIGENLGEDDFCRRCREESMAETVSPGCTCGWPEKPCLRKVLRNGPPFPLEPCEPKPPPSASPFTPVRTVTRQDPPGLGFVLGVAVVLFALVLLLVFALAWFR